MNAVKVTQAPAAIAAALAAAAANHAPSGTMPTATFGKHRMGIPYWALRFHACGTRQPTTAKACACGALLLLHVQLPPAAMAIDMMMGLPHHRCLPSMTRSLHHR